jgi:uncharacterized protein YqgQ
MKPVAHIEVMRRELDTMADEHSIHRRAWLSYTDLLNALDKFEKEMRRKDFVENDNAATGNRETH